MWMHKNDVEFVPYVFYGFYGLDVNSKLNPTSDAIPSFYLAPTSDQT